MRAFVLPALGLLLLVAAGGARAENQSDYTKVEDERCFRLDRRSKGGGGGGRADADDYPVDGTGERRDRGGRHGVHDRISEGGSHRLIR